MDVERMGRVHEDRQRQATLVGQSEPSRVINRARYDIVRVALGVARSLGMLEIENARGGK